MLWENAAVSSFTLDFQVWAVDYTNKKGIPGINGRRRRDKSIVDTVNSAATR